MIKVKRGKIVNIASIAGLVGRNPKAYNSIAYGTICQVSLVEIANNYHYPTVVCDPIDLSHQQ